MSAVAIPARATRDGRGLRALGAVLPVAVLGVALAIGVLLIALTGTPVGKALAAFADGVAGSDYAVVASILRSIPLAMVGLGFIVADRANLTNVGAEGQICVGGIAATAASLYWGAAHLPGPLAWLYPLLLGTLAGALWGAIAGVLKAKRGSNEVITTLLLAFIALQMVYGAVQSESLLRQPKTDSSTLPESLEIPKAAMLPLLLPDSGLTLHVGLVLELLLAAGVWLCLEKSAVGLKLRAIGQNERAARRAGLPVQGLAVGALAASGALGGLAGAVMIQGDQHYLTSGFSSGFGFDGLVVGLLARGSPLAAIGFSLLFGCLRSGGMAMEMSAAVPSAIVAICQGLIVIATGASAVYVARRT